MTYRELVYMIMDYLKLVNDDSTFTEDHIKFLCSKYRALLLNQNYSSIKKSIPSSNYQEICIDLEVVPTIDQEACGGVQLKSTNPIPSTMNVGTPIIYPINYFLDHHITYINKDRMRYVGYNKWLKNIIYCTKGPDDYLYFKSWNPQHMYLEKVKFSGIFSNIEEAEKYSCENKEECSKDVMDAKFPLEEALVPQLIQLVIQDIYPKTIIPADYDNNANDDKSDLATYLRLNTKSDLSKLIENGRSD